MVLFMAENLSGWESVFIFAAEWPGNRVRIPDSTRCCKFSIVSGAVIATEAAAFGKARRKRKVRKPAVRILTESADGIIGNEMKIIKNIYLAVVAALLATLTSCMRWDYADEGSDFDITAPGLFVINEGNFQYGNATLSFYNPADRTVENEVFLRANGMKLGDVAQSMTIHDGLGWVVVNNSHVIFAIDTDTFKERGRIENLTSPRYIHFVSDDKAYVTQIWDNRIFIVNPKTYSITGYITVPDMPQSSGSTEQMVQLGRYVYCNCWSYQNRIIKIDTLTDEVVASLTVGIQPTSLVIDRYDRLWTITNGGYAGSPYGYEEPALHRIDLETFTVDATYRFRLGDSPSEICINGAGDRLYWINDAVWEMDVTATGLPVRPFLASRDTKYYGLTIDPAGGDVYVADAIDYQQQGMIYRYTPGGELIDEFYTGITPGAFCWK